MEHTKRDRMAREFFQLILQDEKTWGLALPGWVLMVDKARQLLTMYEQGEQTAPTGCGHQQVMRHDYHSETWWQCEECEQKFSPYQVSQGGNVRIGK